MSAIRRIGGTFKASACQKPLDFYRRRCGSHCGSDGIGGVGIRGSGMGATTPIVFVGRIAPAVRRIAPVACRSQHRSLRGAPCLRWRWRTRWRGGFFPAAQQRKPRDRPRACERPPHQHCVGGRREAGGKEGRVVHRVAELDEEDKHVHLRIVAAPIPKGDVDHVGEGHVRREVVQREGGG